MVEAVRLVHRAALAALALALAGCASPTQVVPLRVDPPNATVFVDGAQLPNVPSELSLETDRSHVLFFRGEGYRPQQLVLEARERGGVFSLEPTEIRVRLEPLVPTERAVTIESAD